MKVTEAHIQSANIERFTTLQLSKAAFTKDGEWISANVDLNTRLNSTCEHHYFSVTGRTCGSGGCTHGQILEAFPQLQPLIDAHLDCIYTGEPMHSIANGYFFMFGPKDSRNLDYAVKSFGCTIAELEDIKTIFKSSPNHAHNLRRLSFQRATAAFDFKELEAHYVSPIEEYLAPKWLASRDAALACYEEWLNS